MASTLARRSAVWVILCKPQFRLFFCLLCFTCTILYVLLSSSILEIKLDPNSDAIEVQDGVCRLGHLGHGEGEATDSNNCMHPHQFTFNTISRIHKTPIVTLFTYFSGNSHLHSKEPSSSSASDFHNSKINWDALKPWIASVYFMPCNKTEKNKHHNVDYLCLVDDKAIIKTGIEIINGSIAVNPMFDFIANQSRFSAPFVGYVRSGVLFDNSIIESLMYISRIPKNTLQGQGLMIVGRVKYTKARTLSPKLCRNLTLVQELHRKGSLGNAEDVPYIISTKSGFPWNSLRNLSMNIPNIANYVIVQALLKNITVIDATLGLNCVKERVNYWSHTNKWEMFTCSNATRSQQLQGVLSSSGQTSCTLYFTKRDTAGSLLLYQRKNRLQECLSAAGTNFTAGIMEQC